MNTGALLITAMAVTLGLTVGPVSAAPPTGDRLTYVTFSRAFALPGVTLPAGTYTFDVLDPGTSANVVRVRNKERSRTYFLGITERIERPSGVPGSSRSITFGEALRGEAPPVAAWYPGADSIGHRFLYDRTR